MSIKRVNLNLIKEAWEEVKEVKGDKDLARVICNLAGEDLDGVTNHQIFMKARILTNLTQEESYVLFEMNALTEYQELLLKYLDKGFRIDSPPFRFISYEEGELVYYSHTTKNIDHPWLEFIKSNDLTYELRSRCR